MTDKAASPDLLNAREKAILERLSHGLSDQQIANELYISLNTVKWYNRQIYSKMGVSSRTQAIANAKDQRLLDSGEKPSQLNLPIQATPFIGRSREIAEVKKLLGVSRLLTLTGTGGTGKTRLALQAATEVAETFTDGVYFVDLAPLSDPTLVAKAVAASLGVLENSTESLTDTLERVLARRKLLLLIDNFEHVIEAVSLVSELLAASQNLKIVVTSREALHLAGEQVYPVPPMSLPITESTTIENLIESEAGSLFVQRAQMTMPRFEAREDTAPTIAQICLRLDGLPLAIELAAARSNLLSPRALLERLDGTSEDSPFKALAGGSRDVPPRHRTLRDTITWSYDLLEEHEKILFARLAVFPGGWSLDAAEAVSAADLPIDVLDGLASLVDKSLVQPKEAPNGEPRFALLEMIHEYARECLEASGEIEAMRRQHAVYFVEMAERAEPELRRAGYDTWCKQFELEIDNLRAALDWSLRNGEIVLAVRLASALGQFWWGRGYHVEGVYWTQQLLERLDEVPVTYRPKLLVGIGQLSWMHDLDRARQLLNSALELARELGDQVQAAWALAFLSYTMIREPEKAIATAEEGLALFRELNHLPGMAQTLNIIGEIARFTGDDRRARRDYEESLTVCQRTGEVRRICYLYANLAFLAQHEGDYERALKLGREMMQIARDRAEPGAMAGSLLVLAGPIGGLGQPERAAQLLGAADAALERMGTRKQPIDKPEYERLVNGVRAKLDAAAFQVAWDAGREMTLEQAVEESLRERS